MHATPRSRPTRFLLALMAAVMLLTVITPPAPAQAGGYHVGSALDIQFKLGEKHFVHLGRTFCDYADCKGRSGALPKHSVWVVVNCLGHTNVAYVTLQEYIWLGWYIKRGDTKLVECGELVSWKRFTLLDGPTATLRVKVQATGANGRGVHIQTAAISNTS